MAHRGLTRRSFLAGAAVYAGNPRPLAPGMVFSVHMILVDGRRGLTMSLGETSIITPRGASPVTHAPRELVAN